MILFCSYCYAWNVVTSEPWSSNDRCDIPLRVHGSHSWLLLSTLVQHDERKAMEAGGIPNCYTLPSHRLWDMFLFKLFHNGQTLQWRSTLFNHDGSFMSMVLYIIAAGVFRLLFRMSETTVSTSRTNKFHTQKSA